MMMIIIKKGQSGTKNKDFIRDLQIETRAFNPISHVLFDHFVMIVANF